MVSEGKRLLISKEDPIISYKIVSNLEARYTIQTNHIVGCMLFWRYEFLFCKLEANKNIYSIRTNSHVIFSVVIRCPRVGDSAANCNLYWITSITWPVYTRGFARGHKSDGERSGADKMQARVAVLKDLRKNRWSCHIRLAKNPRVVLDQKKTRN